MEYKGYVAKVELDEDAGCFHGRVINTRDVITFEGTSIDELRREFAASVEDYLEFCRERGEEPEKPLSGRVLLRMSPELHRSIFVEASRQDVSLNAWIVDVLRAALPQRRVADPRVPSSTTWAYNRASGRAPWSALSLGCGEDLGIRDFWQKGVSIDAPAINESATVFEEESTRVN